MKGPSKNVEKNPFKKTSSFQSKNKNITQNQKKNINIKISEKKNEKKNEANIDITKLYSLLQDGFNTVSSSIHGLKTEMINSFNELKNEINKNNKKMELVLNLLKDNVSHVTDGNNPKKSTDSEEIKTLVNDWNENESNKNQDINIKFEEELNAKRNESMSHRIN